MNSSRTTEMDIDEDEDVFEDIWSVSLITQSISQAERI
jgi:hypothetical protein